MFAKCAIIIHLALKCFAPPLLHVGFATSLQPFVMRCSRMAASCIQNSRKSDPAQMGRLARKEVRSFLYSR